MCQECLFQIVILSVAGCQLPAIYLVNVQYLQIDIYLNKRCQVYLPGIPIDIISLKECF